MPMPQQITYSNPDGKVSNITPINIIVGRNGAGKSLFLRWVYLRCKEEMNANYINPERGGMFAREPGVESNILANPNWLATERTKNQSATFRPASAQRLGALEGAFHRRMESNSELRSAMERTFKSDYLDKINQMVVSIQVVQDKVDGFLFQSPNGGEVLPAAVSSGEAEIAALGSEILYFFSFLEVDKPNILLIDEPDVHLHPDLQERFAALLLAEMAALKDEQRNNTAVFIATHSSSLIAALGASPMTSIGTKEFDDNSVVLHGMQDQIRKTLPFFGHPLSLAVSNDPLLILEGEDDARVWAHAARYSKGRLRLFPCLANSVDHQHALEDFSKSMLSALYGPSAKGFSIRDGDGKTEPLSAIGCIRRHRLQCYEIENILLTDECLATCDLNWTEFVKRSRAWTAANPGHKYHDDVKNLVNDQSRCRHKKIKSVRNIVVELIDKQKRPWELLVGRTIGTIQGSASANPPEHSAASYVGTFLLIELGLLDGAN